MGSSSEFETDSRDQHLRSKIREARLVDSARIGATVLSLLMAITILGVSGNTLRTYDDTKISSDVEVFPSLWPSEFNIRPTVALVVGSAIVMVTNLAALACSKVSSLRGKIHTPVTFAAPLIGLTVSLIAIIFFYAVNASEEVDTFLSWTCRWRDVSMDVTPHWGTLCRQSEGGLYLAILLIPVEAAALGLAGYQMKVEKYTSSYSGAARKGSPVLDA
ncbi:hypothetical protein QBC37DRAFT_148251 [Rhypophila decipiens]|uniref:Uncharacterized protein n=1 Tax=Rhypophila decipiens TaxID=261697 RepID=A0AAN7B6G2_9PEZI|nr:hypothetical protein QBC37DRAFT_148251 [Rhypophila decipiens]